MANPEVAKNKNTGAAPAANTGNGAKADRFTKIVTDRPMYRVDKCGARPLVGKLLFLARMPPAQVTEQQKKQGQTGEWNAFVFLTTEPTLACIGDGAPEEVPAGTEVLLGESAKLTELRKYIYADKILEVSVFTTGKSNIGGGKSLRHYDLGADFTNPYPRPPQYELSAEGLPPIKQLAGAEGDGEEIPF